MAQLLGDTATKDFLQGLVEAQTEYDKAILTIRTEAQASSVLRPSLIPKDAELRAYFATQDRVEELEEGADLADVDYDRSLTLRAIGDGTFKVLGEDFGQGLTFDDDECFEVNDLVRVGTAIRGKGGNKKREKVIRLEEMLAVSCDDKTTFLTVAPDYQGAESDDIVVTCLEIDGEQILPPPPSGLQAR